MLNNGKVTGVFTDYHYYGTGDIGGAPDEESVKRLEAIVTKGTVDLPPQDGVYFRARIILRGQSCKSVKGPCTWSLRPLTRCFGILRPLRAAELPRYTGETGADQSLRRFADIAGLSEALDPEGRVARGRGGEIFRCRRVAWSPRTYPLPRLNDAWTLAMGAHFHDLAAGTATPRAYEFAWNDDVIAMNQFADVLKSGTEAVSAGLDTEGDGVPVVVFNPLNIARRRCRGSRRRFPAVTCPKPFTSLHRMELRAGSDLRRQGAL